MHTDNVHIILIYCNALENRYCAVRFFFSVTVSDSQFSLSLTRLGQHTGGKIFAVTKPVCMFAFLHEHNTKTSFFFLYVQTF